MPHDNGLPGRPWRDPAPATPVWSRGNGHAPLPPPPGDLGRPAPAPPPAAVPAPIPLDQALVRRLHQRAAELLAAELRHPDAESRGTTGGVWDRRVIGEDLTTRLVHQHVNAATNAGGLLDEQGHPYPPAVVAAFEQELIDAVLAHLFGLGQLQAITDDPAVENVMVLGHDRVRIEYADGRVTHGAAAASSDQELVQTLQRIAATGQQNERALTVAKPTLNMRLPNGNRLAAMHVVTPVPVVVTRRHRTKRVSLADMVALGGIDEVLRRFLAAMVRANLNVIIGGPPNSGKTTLMRAMATEIPRGEWFATMETELELGLHETGEFDWVVPIEAREGHGELGADGRPAGEVSLERIFPDLLRLSMTRVLVGEVRSAEITPMFDAMHTMRGSMCTVHARHAEGVLLRLAELLMRHGAADTLTGAWLSIVNALDYIVYLDMADETPTGGRRHRFVSHVIEIDGLGEGSVPATQMVFGPGADGRARPRIPPQRTRAQLHRAGFDVGLLNTDGAWPAPEHRGPR